MVVPRAQPNVGNKHNPHVLRADEQPREMMRHPPASEKKDKGRLVVREGESEREREIHSARERERERRAKTKKERERDRDNRSPQMHKHVHVNFTTHEHN